MKKFILLIFFILYGCSKDEILDPDSVFLISPSNLNQCSTSTIIDDKKSQVDFSWTESLKTDKYELIVENQLNKLQTKKISLNTRTSIVLDRGINYSWWVISKSNKTSITAKSEIWQFYLEGLSIYEHIPFPTVLLDPKNDEDIDLNDENKYLLKWNGNDLDDDIDYYNLFLGTSVNDIELLESNIKDEEIELELLRQKKYYWKIATFDSNGNSSISQIYNFNTK